MGAETARQRARYERVFFETYGEGPHSCFFCDNVIVKNELVIHHADHNETNDDPANLKPGHRRCHSSYHVKLDWELNHEQRAKNLVGMTGKQHSGETKSLISEKHRAAGHAPTMEARSAGGKVAWTDERRANQSRAQSNRSLEWREKNAAANRGKKRSEESRRRMSEAAKARYARQRVSVDGGDAK